MKKCIVCDIDGCLADSENYQKQYFCSGFTDEEGYLRHILKFPVQKWLETLLKMYWMEFYVIILLTSRHESYRKDTMIWIKNNTSIKNVKCLIMKEDIKQDQAEYKLEKMKEIALTNDIEIMFDDNPAVVKLLQDNDFNAVLVKNLY